MKYLFAGLSLKGLTLNIDLEKLKASQDQQLSSDFLEVISERNELEIGNLKFKFIAIADETTEGNNVQKRRKF